MARVAISVTVFLFLFTLSVSRARDLHNPFSESESAEKIHEPETTTRPQSSKTQQHDTVSFALDSVDPVPLTLLGFHPINRHIHPRRSLPLPLPLSLRRCRHGHRREIPYGNDMIVHSDAATGDRRIPARWARIPELRFPEMMAQHHHHHHHHHTDSKHDHHEKGWFAKRMHEFLNLF